MKPISLVRLGLGLALASMGCDGTPSLHQGQLTMYVSGTASRSTASVEFINYKQAASCTETRFDACVATRCISDPVPMVVSPASNSGTITIETVPPEDNANRALRDVLLTPDSAAKVYSDWTEQGFVQSVWNAGDRLQVSSTGGSVPALGGGVVMPALVEFTVPTFPRNAALPIKRSSDFLLRWNGGEVGTVEVTLTPSGPTNNGSAPVLTCSFAAAGGLGIIPREALATLPMRPGNMTIDVVNQVTQHYGEWDVTLRAATTGRQVVDSQARQVAGVAAIDRGVLVSWVYSLPN